MKNLVRNSLNFKRLRKHFQNKKLSLFIFYDRQTHIPEKCRIQRFVVLRKCTLGDYTYIGYNTNIYHAQIGKFCSISKDVSIGLASHPTSLISTSPIFVNRVNGTGYSWTDLNIFNSVPDKVIIKNDVWIGMKSTIMGGVTVGNGAIIAAHSVVTKDVPAYAVVGGVPAKIIKFRFSEDIIRELENSAWWDLPDEVLKSRIAAFQQEVTDENIRDLMSTLT